MIAAARRGTPVILLSLALGLVLMVLPMPEWALAFRPQWALLFTLYWCLALPERIAVGTAWTVGLLLDLLGANLLGQHALGFAVAGFLCHQFHQRLRLYPVWQQTLVIGAIALLEHAISFVVIGAVRPGLPPLDYWLMPLVSALLWPWLFVLLRDVRRRFRVS
jgi:rod shape-determining protein MreD